MKKLYIHIGCGKCGTTVIQTILKNLTTFSIERNF